MRLLTNGRKSASMDRCCVGLLGADTAGRRFSKGTSVQRGDAGVSTGASLPLDWGHDRQMSRLR
jgi:hypothetical protein